MKPSFPLHIHILTLFLLILLFACSTIGWIGFRFSRTMLESAASDLAVRIGDRAADAIDAIIGPAEIAVNLIRHDPLGASSGHRQMLAYAPFLKEALDGSTALTAIYAGFSNGDFLLLRQIDDAAERATFAAPEGTRYIAQGIMHDAGGAHGRFVFFDAGLMPIRSDDRPDYAATFDPRERGWYEQAIASTEAVKTAPYLFFSNRKVGMSLAARSIDGEAVIGADILLETLGNLLESQKATPGSEIALIDAAGRIVAQSGDAPHYDIPPGPKARPALPRLDAAAPPLAAAAKLIRQAAAGEDVNAHLRLADGDWRIHVNSVPVKGLAPMRLIVAIPDRELLAAAFSIRSTSAWTTAFLVLLTIPLVWYAARAISKPLRQLAGEAEDIRHFEFGKPSRVVSRIREVIALSDTMDGMKRTIRRFLDISQAVAAEPDFDRLLPMLLRETRLAADADAGVLYLLDGETLVPASAAHADADTPAPILLALPPDGTGPLLAAAIAGDAPCAAELSDEDLAATRVDALLAGAPAHQGLAIPLRNRQKDLVGVLLLLRREPIASAQVSFVAALSGSATSSLETRELIKAQKTLFEAFIQLIARAIDAKSPYTGGHCARVPVLTKMLAQAACDETNGAYADFRLDADAWEALHVAAWLHDCGKITTPEYVVDKATKLETIADRIHEVRMRFEVLKRDAEIDSLKAVAAGADAAEAAARLRDELARIDDDFAFVATCNTGGEFLAPEKVERLNAIAKRTWTRTLDDRLGISRDETERRAAIAAPPLPVVEPLLADRPEHRIARPDAQKLAPDNPWGFRMAVPELLYDRGELHNLAVSRGTLSEEERYKINEHMVQTVIMLSQLPFPKHLRDVPEIAGGHNETMDGAGYPKRLTGEQMSPQARMMAIADIFEALTAADRPYKSGKTLSESIRIMTFMVKDRHIDPELFALFLRSGVYRRYAEAYLRPEQIDAVDVPACLAAIAA